MLVAATPSGDPCSPLTKAEVKQHFGTPVEDGETAGMGTGCQWAAVSNDTAFAMIQIISDTTGYGTPIQAPSYQKLTVTRGEGFSVKDRRRMAGRGAERQGALRGTADRGAVRDEGGSGHAAPEADGTFLTAPDPRPR